jgi:hypothetical protein
LWVVGFVLLCFLREVVWTGGVVGHKSTELWEVVLAGFEVGLNGHESDIEAAERGGTLEADVIGNSPNVSSRFAWVI